MVKKKLHKYVSGPVPFDDTLATVLHYVSCRLISAAKQGPLQWVLYCMETKIVTLEPECLGLSLGSTIY